MAEGGSDKYVQPGWYQSKSITTQGDQSAVQQWTLRAKHEDKGESYERFTAKEKVSSGQQFVERSTDRVGFKDEYQRSSTMKIGDKSGYTEYHTEQKVQKVNFGNNSYDSGKGSLPKNKY